MAVFPLIMSGIRLIFLNLELLWKSGISIPVAAPITPESTQSLKK